MRFDRLGWEEACARLAPMVGNPKWDRSGGLFGVSDIIGGGVAFLVSDEAGPLVVIVVEQVEHEQGRELVVRAALQLAACGDLTERVLPEIERVFGVGCDAVTVYTKRAGLVRKMEGAGYTEAAKIMRKKLK
jgi:hypothetical protein